MRQELGFLGVHALLVAPGMLALLALGLAERSPLSLARALGPSYLTGVAIVIPVLIALLVIGVPVSSKTFVVVAALASAALLAVHIRRGPARAPWRPLAGTTAQLVAMGALVAAIVVYFAIGLPALPGSPVAVDNVGIWGLKALALSYYDHLQPDVFLGLYGHVDYPILQPLLESQLFRAMASQDIGLMNVELWLVFGCAIWTAGWLLAPRGRALRWLPLLALLAVVPGAARLVEIGYADVTVACFVGLGVLSLGLWVERRELRHLIFGALMLGAGANTKNEGFVAALACLAAATLVVMGPRTRPSWRPWASGVAVAFGSILPWRLWVGPIHHLKGEDYTPLGRAAAPHFLVERADRLRQALEALGDQLAATGTWSLLVAIFLAVALAAIVARAARRLALFYLAAAGLVSAALLWIYWTSRLDIGFHLSTSIGRTVTTLVFVCALGAAHLCARLLEDDAAESDSPSG